LSLFKGVFQFLDLFLLFAGLVAELLMS